MAAMSSAELWALTNKYFGDLGPAVVNEMYQIALRESGGDPAAKNLVGPDRSYGLWQINTIAGANPDMLKYDLTNPEQNAKAAREIYDRQGITAWSTASVNMTSTAKAAPMQLTPEQIAQIKTKVISDFGLTATAGSSSGGYNPYLESKDVIVNPDGTILILGANGAPQSQFYAIVNPDGSVGYSPDKPENAPKDANQQASGLPTGYAFDPNTGQAYRMGDPTRTPVSSAELQAAAMAETQWGKAGSTPQYELQIDPRTGDLVSVDPLTGTLKTVKSGFGYPEVSPYQARQDSLYGVQESARQADNGFSASIYGTQESGRQSDNSLAASLYGVTDTNAIRRAELGQKDVMDRASLIENARQANLQAALEQFKTRAGLIPQFGQLALNEADIQRQILSQGGDFLYRAFKSQGEDSPLPLVTQADLIGHLRGQLAQLSSIIPPEALKTGATTIDGFSIPAAAPPPTPTPMAAAPVPKAAEPPKLVGDGGNGTSAMTWTPTTANSGATIYVPDGVPDWVKSGLVNQYATGSSGFVFDRAFISGDPRPGQTHKGSNPELVSNPTGAPIAVTPLNKMPPRVSSGQQPQSGGFAAPQMPEGMNVMRPEAIPSWASTPAPAPAPAAGVPWGGIDLNGWAKLWQGILDRWHKGYQQQAQTQPVRGFATGTSYSANPSYYQYPTTAPTPLPDTFSQPTPSQEELLAKGTAALPPAIKALYNGGAPKQRGFDSSLPTLRQLSALTNEELKAYDAYSRLKDQTPLEDIMKEVYSRYAPSSSGFTFRPRNLIGIGL